MPALQPRKRSSGLQKMRVAAVVQLLGAAALPLLVQRTFLRGGISTERLSKIFICCSVFSDTRQAGVVV